MKNEKLDGLLSAIRNEDVDDKVVSEAGQRVWNLIVGGSATADLSTRTLRSCADFQALIPGYLGKQLPPARTLLLTITCMPVSHAATPSRPLGKESRKRFGGWKQSAPVHRDGGRRERPLSLQ